jgi:hypothetical protein
MPAPVDNRDFLGNVGALSSGILGILGAEVRQSRGVYNKYLPIGVQVVGCVLFVEMWISDANRAAYGRRNPTAVWTAQDYVLGWASKTCLCLTCIDRLAQARGSTATASIGCFKDRFSLAEAYAYARAYRNIG